MSNTASTESSSEKALDAIIRKIANCKDPISALTLSKSPLLRWRDHYAATMAREQLEKPYELHIDVAKSKDYKAGFNDAVRQYATITDHRIAALASPNQQDLIDFVSNPKNIAKAVEGSMDKRIDLLAAPEGGTK